MKRHTDAETVLCWLKRNRPARRAEIAAELKMTDKEVETAIHYAVRAEVIARFRQPGLAAPLYKPTGKPLPAIHGASRNSAAVRSRTPSSARKRRASFDCLLHAWGMPTKPLQLASRMSHRQELADW